MPKVLLDLDHCSTETLIAVRDNLRDQGQAQSFVLNNTKVPHDPASEQLMLGALTEIYGSLDILDDHLSTLRIGDA